MIKKCSFFTLVSICCVMAFSTFAKEVIINKKMSATLKKFNPQFVAWETQDYTPTIQKDSVGKKRHPYALNYDVNGDKKSDLILGEKRRTQYLFPNFLTKKIIKEQL